MGPAAPDATAAAAPRGGELPEDGGDAHLGELQRAIACLSAECSARRQAEAATELSDLLADFFRKNKHFDRLVAEAGDHGKTAVDKGVDIVVELRRSARASQRVGGAGMVWQTWKCASERPSPAAGRPALSGQVRAMAGGSGAEAEAVAGALAAVGRRAKALRDATAEAAGCVDKVAQTLEATRLAAMGRPRLGDTISTPEEESREAKKEAEHAKAEAGVFEAWVLQEIHVGGNEGSGKEGSGASKQRAAGKQGSGGQNRGISTRGGASRSAGGHAGGARQPMAAGSKRRAAVGSPAPAQSGRSSGSK